MKEFIYTLQYINQYVHIHELVKTTIGDIYASYKNFTGVYFITLNNLHIYNMYKYILVKSTNQFLL